MPEPQDPMMEPLAAEVPGPTKREDEDGSELPVSAIQMGDLYFEEDVPLVDIFRSKRRHLLYLGFSLVIALIGAGFFIRVDWTIDAPFRIEKQESVHHYRLFDNVYLDAQFVTVGDKLEVGSRIVRVRSAAISQLLAEHKTAQASLERFETSGRETQDADLDHLLRQADVARARIHELIKAKSEISKDDEILLEEMADLVESSRLLHEKYKSLVDKYQAISGIEAIQAEAALNRSSADLVGAHRQSKERLLHQEEEIARKRDQLGNFELARENLKREFAREHEQLRFELRRAEGAIEDQYGAHAPVSESDNFLDLLATTSGKLTYLRRDAQIPSGALIHAVEELGGDYEAVMNINSRQIGLVKEAGESVLLKFDAYPHFEHGPMSGTVTEISSTVDATGTYAMRVSVDPASNDFELSSGMTGTASLVVERRSMLGHLFHQLLGAVDELE